MTATKWMITNPSWTTMTITMHSCKTLNLLKWPYPIPKEVFQNLKTARLFNRYWYRFKFTVQVVPLHIHFRFLKLFLMYLLVCNTHRLCAEIHQCWVMTLHFLHNLTWCQIHIIHIFLRYFRYLWFIFVHNLVTFFVNFLLILFHWTALMRTSFHKGFFGIID